MISIAGFEIIEKVAEGTFFRSFKARQTTLDRVVMIKEILPEGAADEGQLDLLIKEAKRAARLKHSGILQLIDAVEDGGTRCLIMEYPSGTTIAQLISSIGAVPQKKALQIVQDVARALEFAWSRSSLFHGALTPDAITVENGQVKVIGIGLGGIGPEGHGLPAPWMIDSALRNPYLAPEYKPGSRVTLKMDIYALGMILGQMLNGAVPDFARVHPDHAAAVRTVAIPKTVPPALWQFVLRMTEPDPIQRMGKWDDILRTIDLLMTDAPLPVQPSSGKAVAPSKPAAPAKPSMVIKAAKKEKAVEVQAGALSAASTSAEPVRARINFYVRGGSVVAMIVVWSAVAFALWHIPPAMPPMEPKALPPVSTPSGLLSAVPAAPPVKPAVAKPVVRPASRPPARVPAPGEEMSATKRMDELVTETAEYLVREDYANALAAIGEAMNDSSMQSVRQETTDLREFVNRVAEIDEKIAQGFQTMVGKKVTLAVEGHAIAGTLKGVEVGKLAIEQKIDRKTEIITRTHTIDIRALEPLERAKWLGTAQSPEDHAMHFILEYIGRGPVDTLGANAAASGPLAAAFTKLTGRRR